MEHLDEGTIHAWIDGAADATRSREIEAHVAQCSTCSAAVAEARGLVAASSRILNALDDVPGGVVPKRGPVAVPSVAKPPLRRWRVNAWIPAAAAAALILAVGLVQVNKEKAVVAERSTVALDTDTTLRSRLAKLATDSTTVSQPPVAPQTRLTAVGSSAATGAAVGALSRARDMSLADARSRDEGRSAGVAGGAASGPVAAASAPAPFAKKDDVVAESRERVTPRSAAEPTVVTAAPEPAAQRRLDRVTTDVPALPQTLAGCYRIEREVNESAVMRAGNVAGAVAKAAEARATRMRAPAAAVASPPAKAEADFAAAVLPDGVRLDTTARPLGLPVLAQRTDSVLGWWTRFGRDTAQVRFLSGFVVTLTAKNRVPCPER